MSAVAFAGRGQSAGDFSHGGGSIALGPSDAFVSSPAVQEIAERALAYLEAGYAIHFSGPPGTGKTTLAFHVAAQLGSPTILIHGDHEFGSSDLIGRESGYRRSRVVDNYISSVVKLEEEGRALWMDNRITTACRLGHSIIYDEFNRSKPEANNPFLSILSEGVLNVPRLHGRGEGYIRVHPNFRAIFTSNPAEYAGVYRAQDALLDRMITLYLGHYDRDTEIAIAASKAGIEHERAARVVDFVRLCRQKGPDPHYPTLRASIAIARVLAARGGEASLRNPVFQWACKDILGRASQSGAKEAELSSTASTIYCAASSSANLKKGCRRSLICVVGNQPSLQFETGAQHGHPSTTYPGFE
ncbi:gas vesicle protein GvpN [Methylocystis sp.]|uniref:gas vesicle protein GvpN n=1 Tax=Methylocystis sp. TaxID=1911079 RepID=UPI003D098F1C